MSVSVVAAPMVMPLAAFLMPLSSGIVVMSTRADGNGMPLPVTQSFMMPPTMSLPPASTLPAPPSRSSKPTASVSVVGSCRSKPFIASPPLRRALQGGQDPSAPERKIVHPRAYGVVDRVDHRRRDRSDRRLTYTVRAEGAVVLRFLDDHHVDGRRVLDGQHLVIEQVWTQWHTGRRVAHERLGECLPDAHDRATFDLLLYSHRIDRPPDVVRSDVVEHFNRTGPRIDLHFRDASRPRHALPRRLVDVRALANDRVAGEGDHIRDQQLFAGIVLEHDHPARDVEILRFDR